MIFIFFALAQIEIHARITEEYENKELTIGDPFELELIVTHPQDEKISAPFSDSLEPFMIRDQDKTIVQEQGMETNTYRMRMVPFHTGELTTATRSVEIDGVKVKEGQVIGLLDGRLACAGDDLGKTLLDILSKSEPDKAELITFYVGADLPEKDAGDLAELVRQTYEGIDVEVVHGGQPHYQIILSVE